MLPKTSYQIYVDSYYGSFHLAKKLVEQGQKFTIACAMHRPAWLFSNYLMKGLKKGQWKSIFNPGLSITALSFNDNKKCNFITNILTAEASSISKKGKPTPDLVLDYRKHYGFGDKADSFHTKYLYPHKSIKRTSAQLLYYIKMAVVNAWIVFQEINEQKSGQKQFILKLIEQLFPIQKKRSSDNNHKLIKTSNGKNCHYCYQQKQISSSTCFFCEKCQKYLHEKCYKVLHPI